MQIPVHDSEQQLTTKAPQTEVNASLFGQKGRNMQEIGKGFADMGEHIQKVDDLNRKAYATTEYTKQKTALDLEYDSKPNLSEADVLEHNKKAAEIANKLRPTMGSQSDQAEFGLATTRDIQSSKIQFTTKMLKQKADSTKASIDETHAMILEQEAQGRDQTDARVALDELKKKADQAGIYSKEEIYKRDKAQAKAGIENTLDNEMANVVSSGDKSQVDKWLADLPGREIAGKKLDPETKLKYATLANTALGNMQKRQDAEAKDNILNGRVGTMVDLTSGNTKWDQVDMAAISEKDPVFAAALSKTREFMDVAYDPKLPVNQQKLSRSPLLSDEQNKQAKIYAKTITDTFMHNDNEKLSDFIATELEKKGDGLTSGVKLAAFANLTYLKSKANAPKTPEDAKAKDRYHSIEEAVSFLKSANRFLSSNAIADFIVRNFHSGASSKEDVLKEAKDSLRNAIIPKHESLAGIPFTPNKIVDGQRAVEHIHSGTNESDAGDGTSDYSNAE
jgi:hypothetical protein